MTSRKQRGPSERDFQKQVIELAHLCGWRVAHFRPARTASGWRTPVEGDPGFPDLVLAKPGRVIFAELKSEKGKLSPDQEAWLAELQAPTRFHYWGAAYAWRPSDWPQIECVLKGSA